LAQVRDFLAAAQFDAFTTEPDDASMVGATLK